VTKPTLTLGDRVDRVPAARALRWPLRAALAGGVVLAASGVSVGFADSDPGQAATDLIAELEKDAETPGVAEAVVRARAALEKAKAANVKPEAAAAHEAAALEWASLGADWQKVSEREAEAERLEQAVAEMRQGLKHSRALLEETAARKGRAEGLLEKLDDTGALPQAEGASSTPPPAASDEPAAEGAEP
jgi:hypothetical protein